MARWSKKGTPARGRRKAATGAESNDGKPQKSGGAGWRERAGGARRQERAVGDANVMAAANSLARDASGMRTNGASVGDPRDATAASAHGAAAVRTHKALHLAFALFAIVALVAAATLPRFAQAQADKADPALITIKVEGYSGTLPTLTSGTDFTLGQPVKADPCFMTDSSGAQPLASLVEQKQEEGLKITWHTEDGKEFDWLSTPVTKSITVTGTFVTADYQVAVSFNDGKTKDLSVSVPKGKSFAQAYGSEPTAPSKEGWEFVRWVDATTNQAFDFQAPVKSSTSVYAQFRVSDPSKVEPTDPTEGIEKSFSGRCYIGATWSVHPAQFSVSGFTGGLEGYSGTGSCSLPSAAAPSYVWADYTATLKEVNVEAGEVVYDVNITPPDAATPGGPRNNLGLIGYQTVYMQAVIKKSFGGYLEITKSTLNPGISGNNNCYSLEGSVFGVYNQEGTRVAELSTDASGKTAKSPLLPVGIYTIHEEKAPKGYALAQDVSAIVESGQTATAKVADAPQCSLITIAGQKKDAETATPYPMGAATLEDARYRLSYYDKDPSEAGAASSALGLLGAEDAQRAKSIAASLGEPKRTWLLKSDADGNVKLDQDHLVEGDEFYRDSQGNIVLPLGCVVIEEVQAPTGYLLNSTPVVVGLSASGTAEHIQDWETVGLSEQVIRGDLSFTKAKDGSMERLANVPFTITSRTTGESHTLVTDENGMASTAASWTPHSQRTNAGESSSDGIWFEKDAKGSTANVDDSLGALPYDTYDIDEQPCQANEGVAELAHFTVTISRNNTTLDMGTVDNNYKKLEISGEVDKRETLLGDDGTYFYTIDYRSTSNTWVDEFTMTDTLTCAKEGLANLVSLTTPVSFEDYDGKMNVWYRTNLDDERNAKAAAKQGSEGSSDGAGAGGSGDGASDSGNSVNASGAASGEGSAADAAGSSTSSGSADQGSTSSQSGNGTQDSDKGNSGITVNACSTNPYSEANPTNKRIHDFTGWQVWKTNVSTLAPDELKVADLNLQEGEYITAFAFEHGRVEEGFTTRPQDSLDWKRSERYDAHDLTELGEERDCFDLQEATGLTHTEGQTQVAYAPAVLTMQATETALDPGDVDLWNDTDIDTHRDLELHDYDKDSVVQSTNKVQTVNEAIAEAVASKLPKTEDLANPSTALNLTAMLAATCAAALGAQRILRKRAIKRTVLSRL